MHCEGLSSYRCERVSGTVSLRGRFVHSTTVQFVVWAAVGLFIAGCAAFSSRTVATPDPTLMGRITLAWDDLENANQNVGGYYLYYWQADWEKPKRVDVGLQTTYTLQNLEVGHLYTFAVTAYNDKGERESVFSNVVSHQIPVNNTIRDVSRW